MNSQCQICFINFHEKTNVPLILNNCGHSACATCVNSFLKKSRESNSIIIKCPFCQKSHKIDEHSDALTIFPKNYLFLQENNQSEEKPKCEHVSKKGKFFCVDERCKTKEQFCLDCSRKYHGHCQEGFVIESSEFQDKVVFHRLIDPRHQLDPKNIKRKIEKELGKLKTLLFSFVDDFENQLQQELKFTQKLRDDLNQFLVNSDRLEKTTDEKLDKVNVCLKNGVAVSSSIQFLSSFLREGVWKQIDNIMLNFAIQKTKCVSQFNDENISSRTGILERYSRFLELSGKQLISGVPTLGITFETPRFLDSVCLFLGTIKMNFNEIDGSGFDQNFKSALFEELYTFFEDQKMSSQNLSTFLLAEMKEKLPKNEFLLFEHSENGDMSLKVSPEKYLTFRINFNKTIY